MPDESEPPIREFADRGTLWLLESPENLRGLLRLVAVEIADRLDFTRAERINRSFIPDDLHKQEADLLYRVPFREAAGEALVYVLLEQQSRPDRAMGLRLLSYMIQLWETQQRGWQDAKLPTSRWRLYPVVPIIFYTGRRHWTHSLRVDALMDAPVLLNRFVPQHETLFLNLHEMPPEKLTGSAVALALQALQAAEEPTEALAKVLAQIVPRLEALPETAQAEWRRAMHYLLLLIRHKREPEERASLYEVVTEAVDYRHTEEIEKMAMTDAQVLISRGRREGRAEGRIEGQREMLLLTLETRFGLSSAEIVAKVNALAEPELVRLAKQALTAQTLESLDI